MQDVDYNKLIEQFGCSYISNDQLDRMERLLQQPIHPWLRRGIFFSHRDLDMCLDLYEQGKPFYLYTGRGPSSESMHVGHLIPFMFTKWLQDAFNVPLVIQITDDEKYYNNDMSRVEIERIAIENIKDIIAMGFDPNKTFIFRNLDYYGDMYRVIVDISKHITMNQVKGAFGFDMEDSIGKWSFPTAQIAPSFSASFPHIFHGDIHVPCLIPQAIDQDPYFRMTRKVAPKLGYLKPSLIHSVFLPAIDGPNTKMSSSVSKGAIFLTDTDATIRKKVSSMFSGGGITKEKHMQHGANLDIDVPYQWLRFFLYDDDRFEYIGNAYSTGKMTTGEIKKELSDILIKMIGEHQKRRGMINDVIVSSFMTKKPLPPFCEALNRLN